MNWRENLRKESKMSEGNKLLYEFYKRHKICVRCGQESAVKGKTRCITCLEKDAESQRKTRAQKTEEQLEIQREKNRIYAKERYKKLKEQGLCVNCGKPQTSTSEVYCIDCAIKNQRRNNKRKSGISRSERKAFGKCYVCNEPVGKCGTMCDKCYDMVCANLPKKMNSKLYNINKMQNKAIFNN